MNKICILPWMHTEIRPDGSLNPCCLFRGKSNHNIKNTTIQEYAESELKSLRDKFLKGEYIPECENCWYEENAGKVSKRIRSNNTYKIEDLDLVSNNFNLRYLDLKLGNTCNLKCVSCSSEYSSKWLADELKLYGRAFGKGGKSWSETTNNDYIRENLKHIEHIDFTGGEPFLIKEHFSLLELLDSFNLSQNISLHYNTNGTIKLISEQKELLKKFKRVEIMFSIDGIGNRFEYLRYPAKWAEVESNFKELLTEGFNVSVCHTLSILNVYYFNEFIDWFKSYSLDEHKLFINFLHFPDHLKCSNLPSNIKEKIKTEFKYKNYSFIIDFMLLDQDYNIWSKFKDYIQNLDRIRKTDFKNIFIELSKNIDWNI